MIEIVASIALIAMSGAFGQEFDLRNDPDANRVMEKVRPLTEEQQSEAFSKARGKDLKGFLVLMIRFRLDMGNRDPKLVRNIQKGLSRYGYSTPQTGKFDSRTESAIRRFLTANVQPRTDSDTETTKGVR